MEKGVITIGELPYVDGKFPCIVVPNHATYTTGNAYGVSFIGATNSAGTVITISNGTVSTTNVYGYGFRFGSNQKHQNLPPYYACYVWRRTE